MSGKVKDQVVSGHPGIQVRCKYSKCQLQEYCGFAVAEDQLDSCTSRGHSSFSKLSIFNHAQTETWLRVRITALCLYKVFLNMLELRYSLLE